MMSRVRWRFPLGNTTWPWHLYVCYICIRRTANLAVCLDYLKTLPPDTFLQSGSVFSSPGMFSYNHLIFFDTLPTAFFHLPDYTFSCFYKISLHPVYVVSRLFRYALGLLSESYDRLSPFPAMLPQIMLNVCSLLLLTGLWILFRYLSAPLWLEMVHDGSAFPKSLLNCMYYVHHTFPDTSNVCTRQQLCIDNIFPYSPGTTMEHICHQSVSFAQDSQPSYKVCFCVSFSFFVAFGLSVLQQFF